MLCTHTLCNEWTDILDVGSVVRCVQYGKPYFTEQMGQNHTGFKVRIKCLGFRDWSLLYTHAPILGCDSVLSGLFCEIGRCIVAATDFWPC